MVEGNADIEVVTSKINRELRRAEDEHVVRAAEEAAKRAELLAEDQNEQTGAQANALEVVPAETQTAPSTDTGSSISVVRIAIVAVLVLVLFLAWIAERRSRRPE